MMDPDHDLFVAIVEAGSISAAARTMRLSVASVSKRLQRLEARLSVRLLHRTTRSLSPTAEGDTLYRALVEIRAALALAEQRVSSRSRALSGPLRMTAPTSFGRLYLAPPLAAFMDNHPGIDLQVDLTDEYVDLREGRYDLAIRITAPPPPALIAHLLAPSPRVLCAAPAYLDRHGSPQTLDALARHRVLATDAQLPWRLSSPAGHATFRGASAVRTNSSEMVRELALAGSGVALRSLWDVAREIASGQLVRILPEYEGSQHAGVYVVHTPMPHVPAAMTEMIGHLIRHFSAHKAAFGGDSAA